MSKRILIENAKPGHILAEKLTRHDGVLLASQGAEVTEGLLRMLSRMNIDSLVIEEAVTLSPEEMRENFDKKCAVWDERFKRVINQPVLMALKKAMIAQAKAELDEGLAAIEAQAAAADAKAATAPEAGQ